MPFNLPFKKSSNSRGPSSPTPRPAISTNTSTCSDSTSASETSSLEAAPMRPPAGSLSLREGMDTENGAYGYGRVGFGSRMMSGANNASGTRSPLQINTSPPTSAEHSMTGKQRQDSTTSTLIPPQRSSLHSPTFSAPTSRESSVTRSPVTPRARQGTYHTFSQPSTSQALLVDPEAQQFLGVRGSSSGPDLASLRRRAEERRHEMNGSFVGTGKEGSSVRGTSTSPTINEDKHDADSGTGKDISREGTGGSSKGEPLRRAVGLQDFVFGEVIGRGSYSTVILATQKATHLPYAIKILDQYQLVQEKKTKYAKIERDALVRLGPMAVHPTRVVGTHPNGVASARASRRGSEASEQGPVGGSTTGGNGMTGSSGGVASAAVNGHLARLQTSRIGQSASLPGWRRGAQPPSVREGVGSDQTSVEEASKGERAGDEYGKDGQPTTDRLSVRPDANSAPIGEKPSSPRGPVSAFSQEPPRKPKARPRSAHPGVVRLHYTFKDDTSLYFVLDLAINGELLGLIKKHGSFDVDSAKRYAAQLIDTVEFMHERGVIHRDLKPENILLDDDMRIKVTDFGSAKVLDLAQLSTNKTQVGTSHDGQDDRKRSFVGTAEYVSPEVLRNEHASFPADIWAFGCIVYQMLAGRPPFRGGTEYLTFQQVLKAEYDFPEGFDEQAKDLVQQVLKLDPTERLDIEGIKAHPYFTGVDFARIWTDVMPDIHTGIKPPAQTTTMSFAWDELVGQAESSESGMQSADAGASGAQEPVVEDDDSLEAPRRRWIEHGGGVGTFSSGSGTTDDTVSLVGGTGLASKVNSREAKPVDEGDASMLPHGRSSLHWSAEDRRNKWSEHLVEGEEIIYQSPILLRSGLLLPKRRILAITSLPRLICAKEDPATETIKVQAECLFKLSDEGEQEGAHRETKDQEVAKKRLVKRFYEKAPRGFVVQTGEKERVFITDRDDVRARWIEELDKVKPRTS